MYDLASLKESYGCLGTVVDLEFSRKTLGSLHFLFQDKNSAEEGLR